MFLFYDFLIRVSCMLLASRELVKYVDLFFTLTLCLTVLALADTFFSLIKTIKEVGFIPSFFVCVFPLSFFVLFYKAHNCWAFI